MTTSCWRSLAVLGASAAAVAAGCGGESGAVCGEAAVRAGFGGLPPGFAYTRLPENVRRTFTTDFVEGAPLDLAGARGVVRDGAPVAFVYVAAPPEPQDDGENLVDEILTAFEPVKEEHVDLPGAGRVRRVEDADGLVAFSRALSGCTVVAVGGPDPEVARRIARTVLR